MLMVVYGLLVEAANVIGGSKSVISATGGQTVDGIMMI